MAEWREGPPLALKLQGSRQLISRTLSVHVVGNGYSAPFRATNGESDEEEGCLSNSHFSTQPSPLIGQKIGTQWRDQPSGQLDVNFLAWSNSVQIAYKILLLAASLPAWILHYISLNGRWYMAIVVAHANV